MRIVSLIASATEIVCALGLRDFLAGRSHECDVPDDVSSLPALTAPKFDTGLSSRQIDDAVKGLMREGLSVYHVDQDTLRALAPDVIVTQDQCEVCAASLKDVEAAVCDWVGRPVKIISLRPNSLADIFQDVVRVGRALGRAIEAQALVANMQSRIAGPGRAVRPKVACIEWINPLMTAGHWIPELVEHAAGLAVFAQAGGPSPYVPLDDLGAADPDMIVVAPCGFDVPRSNAEMGLLADLPAWRNLRAVRMGRVAIADGNKFFNRPSPAVADTVEILRDITAHFIDEAPARFGNEIWRRWCP